MTEISRRKFIQLTVLSGAVTAAGCKTQSHYDHELYKSEVTGQYGGYSNRVYPYINQPDGLMDGVPQYFATACQMCPAGCGLFIRTMSGRALKAEGNPTHPVAGGHTCARGQASVQHLYDPDRIRFPALVPKRGAAPATADWETALSRTAQGLQGARGRVAVLADAITLGRSPTLMGLAQQFAASVGGTVTTYSLLDDAPWRAAARAVYGRSQVPAYQLDQADYILSFGSDFLEAWPSPVYYNRLFGEFRQGPRRAQGEHGRFVYIGPRMSMTAAKADQWLPCNPGSEAAVAQGILSALGGAGLPVAQAAAASGLTAAQITALADGFRAAGARAVAIPGNGLLTGSNATANFTTVESLNAQVRSRCVSFGTAALAPPAPSASGAGSSFRQMQALIGRMQAGQVGALVILGQPNPVFTLPTATQFAQALDRVPFIAALTPFEDETTAHADVLLPTRTFLEDWGDDLPAVLPAGARMVTLRQPIIDPVFVGGDGDGHTETPPPQWMDTRMTGDLLLDLARRAGRPLAAADMRDAVRTTWATLGQANLKIPNTDNDQAWVAALAKGGYWTQGPVTPAVGRVPADGAAPSAPLPPGQFALQLYPHIYHTDGRHANLGWMQEIPDPMTSAVWNSWIEINMQTAHQLGIRTGDIVRLTTSHGTIEAPAVPYPGIHPNVVAMPIGQGHAVYGRNAAGRGANPLAVLDPTADAATGALAFSATPVRLTKVRSAKAGYHPELETLVLVQDRPGGQEPDAVKDLIHTTSKEWKAAKRVYGAPQAEGSIFKRNAPGSTYNPGEDNPGE